MVLATNLLAPRESGEPSDLAVACIVDEGK